MAPGVLFIGIPGMQKFLPHPFGDLIRIKLGTADLFVSAPNASCPLRLAAKGMGEENPVCKASGTDVCQEFAFWRISWVSGAAPHRRDADSMER